MSKPKDSNSKILEKEIENLHKRINVLETDNAKLEATCRENGILDDISEITNEEAICITQIRRLRDKSVTSVFTETDAKILDILYRNLRLCRGQEIKGTNARKTKKLSSAQLLEMVKSE